MLCASVITSASPEAIPMVPSVVTKGGSFSHATSAPFANPNAAPSANAPARASDTDPVLTATAASTTLASVRTAPIERSMPSVIKISVIGSASSGKVRSAIVHRQAQNTVLGHLMARELPDDAFVAHHVGPIADLDHLR